MEIQDVMELVSVNILQVEANNTNKLLKIISNCKFLGKKYS